jgi:hypothetical protein
LNDPGEIEFKNSILFNLRTGNMPQQLFVYNTYPLSYSFSDSPPFINPDEAFAGNAKITITDGKNIYNKFKLTYTDTITKNRCYTNADEIFIYPNKEYSIEVESNGQLINGKIITIGDFEISDIKKIEGGDKDRLYFDVSWYKCSGAKYYKLISNYFYMDSVITGSKDGKFVWDFVNIKRVNSFYIEIDTLTVSDNKISRTLSISLKSDSLIVYVEAYDFSSYNHYYKGIKKVGIENAYGYLGSSTIKSSKVIFKN